ncbi:MAG: glycine cleavage system aminomethyltransferase GcvT [Alphaproteobacteria bacterium]|nr:glycine cleavage system aminomethyltransferase GcvT [Alphaproteobacteria bacterium]
MLRTTPLHGAHGALGAKMGAFAGYDMPLYYELGVKKEHEWVRSHAGLFDVSHMGQIMVRGRDKDESNAVDFFETITPSSFDDLAIDHTKYTVLTNEQGGIIDDLMVTRTGLNAFHCVINAGCKEKDIDWIKSHIPDDDALEFTYFEDWALLALQGPSSEAVVRDVLGIDLADLPYMGLWARDDYQMFISRLGYTGEDGFEISVPNEVAVDLWQRLLAHEEVKPIGLAARDSLRLEMGYCLYGHDIDDTTSPVEAGLRWVLGKENTGFIGADVVLGQIENGVSRKRVGVRLVDKGIAREGAPILDENGLEIGSLTSGGYAPSLEAAVGQGYIPIDYAKEGTDIFVNVRGRKIAAKVSRMPFIPANTKRS